VLLAASHSDTLSPLSDSSSGGLIPAPVLAVSEFEPVLNVPALFAFVVIAVVFGLLQWRIAAIGRATDRRNDAVRALRDVKSRQLNGEYYDRNDIDSEDDDETNDLVKRALDEYREAYEEVERLRTIAPGVRVIAPPSAQESLTENVAAAQQFLGITPEGENEKQQRQGRNGILSGAAAVLLGVIALSQLALLVLFLLDLDSSKEVLNAIDSLTSLE